MSQEENSNMERELAHNSQISRRKPLAIFEPRKPWVSLNLSYLWAYRELFYFLIWRDVKVRYKQTLLGVAWALLQPLCTMFLFSLLFGRLAGISSNDVPYPIFAFAGLFPWLFFSNALVNSGNSLVGSSHLITKAYFPRMLIPGAAVVAGLVEFTISFLGMICLMLYYGIPPTWNMALLPLLILLTTLLAIGIGMWMSALNVKYRDIRFALPFVIQLWFFASPIIYPSSFLPKKWGRLLALNPITGIIEGFRSSFFGRRFDWTLLIISSVITLAILLYSAYAFQRMEKSFADVV